MKLCVCGFNLADAEPNAEGRYFCPWSGHEFEESDVKEAKSTSAAEPEPEPETPPEPAAEAEPEPEPAPEPEPEPEVEPEPETPGEEKGGD